MMNHLANLILTLMLSGVIITGILFLYFVLITVPYVVISNLIKPGRVDHESD